jgi:uncharacterized RDD family membrane protein YckC
VKCPKCDYLGFETGDRCKNCGYDFSLLSVADTPLDMSPDYDIDPPSLDDVPVHVVIDDARDAFDDSRLSIAPEDLQPSAIVAASTANAPTPVDALPLFRPHAPNDDEPLIKLPPAPRPPLAVRRTPDTPRLRPVSRPASHPSPVAVLEFAADTEAPRRLDAVSLPRSESKDEPRRRSEVAAVESIHMSTRAIAVLVDYAILLGIDVGVVYFTARMAGLSMGEWRLLPMAPMLTFLGLLKVAYFYAFTAVGGQTIGKMAMGTCVVSDDGNPVDAGRAMRRTSAGALSLLLLGLGFVPALFGDGRALHDRLSGTRVVRLRSV